MADASTRSRRLFGWGRYPVARAHEIVSKDLERATRDAVLTRGLGRSYGDSSLPPDGRGPVAGTRLADRVLSFDEDRGVLRAQAGLSLRKLQRRCLPRGWSSPVLPGTHHVTLGGMVASDVHGKNHHVSGCFGEHVRALRMRVADGNLLEIDEISEPELFRATLGGMGLTGHILEVEVQLERAPSAWILQQSERLPDAERLLEGLRDASRSWPFTVCWADGLAAGTLRGRGLLIRGRWARADEAPHHRPGTRPRLPVPFDAPNMLLNQTSVGWFNSLYFHRHGLRPRERIVHPEVFFHPLDVVRNWNRLYGRRGFTQYQCVVPELDGKACRELLEIPARHGAGSFLTVIKDCGAEGRGTLSFPRPGVSLALDLPLIPGRTQAAVDALNEHVLAAGGRIYLAKDALTRPEHFHAMERRLEAWNAVRRRWDPTGRLASAQSVRLLGDGR